MDPKRQNNYSRTAAALVLCALLLACTAQPSRDETRRIEQLYTHTQIMLQVTSDQDAQALGMYPEKFVGAQAPLDRLQVLEATMGLASAGSTERRIAVAEERMNDLMIRWQNTPSGRGEISN